MLFFFFFSSRRRHTRCSRDWSSDVCSSDLLDVVGGRAEEHQDEVATVVAVLERPELCARRGARGGEGRSTHWADYNPCTGGARGRAVAGLGPRRPRRGFKRGTP